MGLCSHQYRVVFADHFTTVNSSIVTPHQQHGMILHSKRVNIFDGKPAITHDLQLTPELNDRYRNGGLQRYAGSVSH